MDGGEGSPKTPVSSRELFAKVFPSYLALGMTYNEFYREDHELVIAYRKAAEMKREKENADMWLQGLYVYQAVSRVAPLLIPFAKHPKAEPYLDKPIPMFEKDKEESEQAVMDKGIAYMNAKMIEINKRFSKE